MPGQPPSLPFLVALLWPQKEWFADFLALLVEEFLRTLHAVYPAGAPCEKVTQGAGVAEPTWLEAIRRLVCKAGFSEEVQRSSFWISGDPQHAFVRESGLDSFFGIVEGILLHAGPLISRM